MNKRLIKWGVVFVVVLVVLIIWSWSTKAHINTRKVTKVTITNGSNQVLTVITNKQKIKEIADKINAQVFHFSTSRPKMLPEMNVIFYYSNTDKVDNFGYSKFLKWKNGTACKADSSAYNEYMDLNETFVKQ